MALKDTVDRLSRLKEEPPPADRVVDDWRSAVSDLYDRIADWLAPYVDEGTMLLTRHPKSAHEERTGPYDIDVLDIDVGPETVRLDPRGAVVIGARGRIDMTLLGRGDPVMLILAETDAAPEWSIVDRTRRTTLTPLTKDAFEAALDAVLDAFELPSGLTM